jgi:LacI family transcriptional regulator
MGRQVDGIVVIDPSMDNLHKGFYDKLSKSIPMIIVNGSPEGYKGSFVCYDEQVGTEEAFNYLLELGHKKFAFIRGHKSFSYDIKEKIYKNMIKEHQFQYERIVNVGKGNSNEAVLTTQKEIEKLMEKEEKPTAIFACNDLMAVGALNACINMGIRVPEDISIVGFDNTILAEITRPKLTSVDLNMKEIGHRAALELLDIIEGGAKSRTKVILDTRLVARESCGSVASN